MIQNMTGLEVLRAMKRVELPLASIMNTIPMSIEQAEEGLVVFRAMANNTHLNPMGGVHGGFAAAVLDSVTGCAVHSVLGAGIGFGTIDLNIKMIKPVLQNKELIAEGKIINLSKSLGISEGVLKDEEGRLLATATATCMILTKSIIK